MRAASALIVLAAAVGTAFGQALINTPASLVTCQPALITWSGGVAPYYVSILPGGQSSGSPLKQFDATSATSLTYTVDIAANTAVTFEVRDSTGATNFSDQVTITAGTSSACVNGNTSESAEAGSVAVQSSATSAISDATSSAAAATSANAASSVKSSIASEVSSITSSIQSQASAAVSSLSSASAAQSSSHSGAGRAVAGVGSLLGFAVAIFTL